VSSWWSIAT